jgi:hypothetical protein
MENNGKNKKLTNRVHENPTPKEGIEAARAALKAAEERIKKEEEEQREKELEKQRRALDKIWRKVTASAVLNKIVKQIHAEDIVVSKDINQKYAIFCKYCGGVITAKNVALHVRCKEAQHLLEKHRLVAMHEFGKVDVIKDVLVCAVCGETIKGPEHFKKTKDGRIECVNLERRLGYLRMWQAAFERGMVKYTHKMALG